MPFDPPSAVGLVFTFAGQRYTATQISVSRSASEFDVTSTDLAEDALRRYRVSEVENCEIKVDWVGLTIPPIDSVQPFSLTAGLGHTGAYALCTGLNITAQASELIRGSATFKVSYD